MNRGMTKTLFARCAPDLVKWLGQEAKRRSTKHAKLSVSEVVRDILEEKRTGQPIRSTDAALCDRVLEEAAIFVLEGGENIQALHDAVQAHREASKAGALRIARSAIVTKAPETTGQKATTT